MLTIPSSLETSIVVREKLMEDERLHDVEIILENLFSREEATVKIIFACLYDVGAVNLLNQRVQNRTLNRFSKRIARMTKPAFQFFAVRWVKKNCPHLITEWLRSQVDFAPTKVVAPEQVTDPDQIIDNP